MTTLHFRSDFDPTAVIRVTAAYYFTPTRKLRGRSHCASVVLPRHVSMYLLRKHTNLSLAEVGGMLGKRHHATVLLAVRDVMFLRTRDPDLNHQIETIEGMLANARVKAA